MSQEQMSTSRNVRLLRDYAELTKARITTLIVLTLARPTLAQVLRPDGCYQVLAETKDEK